jgi:hypothetical protein
MEQIELKQSNMILQLLEEKNVLNDKIIELKLKNEDLDNRLKDILKLIKIEKETNLKHWRNIYWLKNSEGKIKYNGSVSEFKSDKDITLGQGRGYDNCIGIINKIIEK